MTIESLKIISTWEDKKIRRLMRNLKKAAMETDSAFAFDTCFWSWKQCQMIMERRNNERPKHQKHQERNPEDH